MPTMRDYEVVVIGVGSAGSRAAATAHQAGARTLGVEGAERMGGLCILRGCMPTKTLLETAHRLHDIRDAERFGIRVGEVELDFAAHMERMRSLVDRFARAKVSGIEGAGYPLERGAARFVDPHTIEVNGKRITADCFVLATGSKQREMPVPVEDGVPVLGSDDMFLLKEPPRSCLSLGAGPVALEFSQWLARIGTKVTLCNRSPLLKHASPVFGAELALALGEEMTVHTGVKLQRIERSAEGGARAYFAQQDGSELVVEADVVLNGLGRVANFDGLGLDEVFGWNPDELPVDAQGRSPAKHIFVAGDATNDRLLLHEANYEGIRAGRNALRQLGQLDGEMEGPDPRVPLVEVVFSDPVFAVCGESPGELDARGVPYHVAEKRFAQQGRGIVVGATHGLMQLIAERGSGKLLSATVLGPRADDLIHCVAVAMRMGATAQEFFETPWYHPTLSEAYIEVARELARQD
jgi:pyruvate/2-oxoglutarate dehydrogenase complex dihydrolipoamide dehydrogenase (E3) component